MPSLTVLNTLHSLNQSIQTWEAPNFEQMNTLDKAGQMSAVWGDGQYAVLLDKDSELHSAAMLLLIAQLSGKIH